MATMHPLSSTLKSFESSYASLSGVKSAQSEVSSSLNDASNQLDSALNGFTTASSDAQCAQIKSSVSLVKSACSVVKSHVESDISALLGHAAEVKATIDEINEKIKEGSSMDDKVCTKKADPENGIPEDVYEDNQDVIRLNKEIDLLNKKGEDQLNAMAGAIGGVSFGVAGNMKVGGSLGASVTYGDNYKFDPNAYVLKEEPKKEEPKEEEKEEVVAAETKLNVVQEIGCGVVGAVEGVAKVAEGVVDAAVTVVAGVTSAIGTIFGWFGWKEGEAALTGASKTMTDFAKRDTTNELVSAAVDATSGLTGVTSEAYNNSAGRSIGKTVGGVAAHAALWLVPGGAIVSSVSIAGESMERSLQQGKDLGTTILSGAASGAFAYVGGKALGNLAGKATNALSRSTGLAGKIYRASTLHFGPGWASHSLGAKAVSVVTSPLRGAAKVIGALAKADNAAIQATRMGRAMARADTAATQAIGRAVNAVAGKVTGHGSGASSGTGSGSSSGTGSSSGSSGGTSGSSTTHVPRGASNPSAYGINQSAFDELVAEGYTPGTPDFISEASSRFAGAKVPTDASVYGITQDAFDELVADGFTAGTQEFMNEAASRFVIT